MPPFGGAALSSELALALIDFAPDGVVVVDDEGTILSVNRRLGELFGYSTDELVGASIDVLVPERFRTSHVAHRTHFGATPEVRTMGIGRTLPGRRRDGSELVVEVGLSPMHIDDGPRVVAIVRDVSEQAALRAEADLIQQTVDAIRDGVFMFDSATLRFTYVNAGATIQTGFSTDELVEMTPLDLTPRFSDESFRAVLRPLLDDECDSIEFETVHRRVDGIEIPVDIILQYPVLGDEGLDRPLIALARDISERKTAEERLRASEAAFRRAFADAPVAMAVTDLDEHGNRSITEVNKALEELLGYPAEDLTRMSFSDITHPDDDDRDVAAAKAMVAGIAVDHHVEKRYLRADGTHLWAQLHTAVLERGDSRATVLAHIIDISHRKLAEKARDRYERQTELISQLRLRLLGNEPLTVMLQGICHDVRASELASDALVLERTDREGAIAAWGEAARPGPTELSRVGIVEAMTAEGSRDREPVVLRTFDRDVGADRQLLDVLHADVVVIGSLGQERALALACGDAAGADDGELDMLTRLVVEVGEAVELSDARANQQRVGLLEDRERIATDLHDVVIQRLFAAGMRLQAAVPLAESPVQERLSAVVDELDRTIAEIRDTIFALNDQTHHGAPLSARIEETVRANEQVLGFRPSLAVDLSVDRVGGEVAEHIVPVVTEILSNIARHAEASAVDIVVHNTNRRLTITVIDDGIGIDPEAQRGNGLDNLARRARDLGGGFSVGPNTDAAGTTAHWWALVN